MLTLVIDRQIRGRLAFTSLGAAISREQLSELSDKRLNYGISIEATMVSSKCWFVVSADPTVPVSYFCLAISVPFQDCLSSHIQILKLSCTLGFACFQEDDSGSYGDNINLW